MAIDYHSMLGGQNRLTAHAQECQNVRLRGQKAHAGGAQAEGWLPTALNCLLDRNKLCMPAASRRTSMAVMQPTVASI